ncbi:MAG: hypothetical protein C1943_18800 [Halochromatium sp.]|nr:hypothetical protein [Halochromatium sp.]
MRRLTWEDGHDREHGRGIALGCPLSPLLGGLHLAGVDQAMSDGRWFYVRFMDDLLVLAPSRPRLREAVKRLHGLFDGLHLRMHPEKTFVGRWEQGFESERLDAYLRYWLGWFEARLRGANKADAHRDTAADMITRARRIHPTRLGVATCREVAHEPPIRRHVTGSGVRFALSSNSASVKALISGISVFQSAGSRRASAWSCANTWSVAM